MGKLKLTRDVGKPQGNLEEFWCQLYGSFGNCPRSAHTVVVVVDPLLPDYWGESASVV